MKPRSPHSIFFKLEGSVGILEFNLPDSRVNLLTSPVMQELNEILDEVNDNSRLEALLVTSAKPDIFIAGADIKEIEGISNPDEGEGKSLAGQQVLNRLEDLRVPAIAVIDGVALGGGCELALACRYRVATLNEKVKIGLPEVNLGIVPGFGGTYRLPRLVGLPQALQLILTGKILGAQEAFKIGLVDRLFPRKNLPTLLQEFVSQVKGSVVRGKSFRRKDSVLTRFLNQNPLGQHAILFQAHRDVKLRTKGFYPAPLKAVEVIDKTINARREAALATEARAFGELAVTDVSKNLVKVFYLSEKYKKLSFPELQQVRPNDVRKCGVVGAGVMGGGIAQLLSHNHIDVRLKDVNYPAVAKGLQAAAGVFRQAVKRKKMKASDVMVRMARITGTVDTTGFQNVDCVIEAVVEDMEIKKKVFREMSQIIPVDAVLCTNTSALSVTEMAGAAKNPAQVVGLHFFNPVHRMPLVEIISTGQTSPQALATTLHLAKRLGKTPIVVKDTPGFLVNRILLSYVNEAGRILEEGAGVEFIDKAMTDFGMPMGPLTLADEVGIDVGVKVLHVLQRGFGERFRPTPVFEKVLGNGLLGKKSGRGFYLHEGTKRRTNSRIHSFREAKPQKNFSAEQCRNRMVFMMVNEAARCLDEKVVDDAGAVDIGMILGAGFPPFRGGLLRYADSLGMEMILDILKLLEAQLSAPRFQACPYLLELKISNKTFYSA